MRERGCFPTTPLAQLRRPCRPRHPYAVTRTFLQCVCTRHRNCIGQLSPFSEYALRTIHFPADNPHLCGAFAALIKLTHYPHPAGPQLPETLFVMAGLVPAIHVFLA